MAAGFTLTMLYIDVSIACLLIGLATFILSYQGVFIGNKIGTWRESKAEVTGGVVLILIGLKILLL